MVARAHRHVTVSRDQRTLRRIKPKHAHDPEYFAGLYAHTLATHPELEHILDIIDEDDRRIFSEAS